MTEDNAQPVHATPPAGYASTTTLVTFAELHPGDKLALSIDYHWGPHGEHEINFGQSEMFVQADGRITFPVVTDALTHGHQGTARAWARLAGSEQGAPPVANLLGHPAQFKFHLP